jgi:hypothetical protein
MNTWHGSILNPMIDKFYFIDGMKQLPRWLHEMHLRFVCQLSIQRLAAGISSCNGNSGQIIIKNSLATGNFEACLDSLKNLNCL